MDNLADTVSFALKQIEDAIGVLHSGPVAFGLKRLLEHSSALIGMSPLGPGDRAEVCHAIDCDNGWASVSRSLDVGATGIVKSVDYEDGQFVCDWVPDVSWWCNCFGEWEQSARRYTFHLRCADLKKVAPCQS